MLAWNGQVSYQRTLTVPADNFYSGPVAVTVAIIDAAGRVYSLSGAEEVGRGHYVVAGGLNVQGSVPADEREENDTLGGRMTLDRVEVTGPAAAEPILLFQDNTLKTTASPTPVTIRTMYFTTSGHNYQELTFNVNVRGDKLSIFEVPGRLQVYLDGRLIEEREAMGLDYAAYSFVHDASGLPDGGHTVEFKLIAADGSFNFSAGSSLCEARLTQWIESGLLHVSPPLLYQDNAVKATASYAPVTIETMTFVTAGHNYQELKFDVKVKGDRHGHFAVRECLGHLLVCLDGQAIGEYVGVASEDGYTSYSFTHGLSALADGLHTVEFKLYKTGDDEDFLGCKLEAANGLCEVRLTKGRLAPFAYTSPEARTVKPIKSVVATVEVGGQAVKDAMRFSVSADGGVTWLPMSQADLGREFPVSGSPKRVKFRIANITTELMGGYAYHLRAVPDTEPEPVLGAANFTTAYDYDDYGNRKTETSDGTPTNYTYLAHCDRLQSKDGVTFAYDKNGNLIQKVTATDTWNYIYDYANRLAEVRKNGAVIAGYTYDFSGLRLTANGSGATAEYLYLGNEIIWESKGSSVKNYIYALGKHLARVDGVVGDPAAAVYWYHTDHLGTAEVMTDKDSNVVWRGDQRAFGNGQTTAVNLIENTHTFTGKEFDVTIGLYYYNSRFYDSELGRFITEDTY